MPLILFDLDGTLVDPGEGITSCLEHLAARAYPGSRELLAALAERSWSAVVVTARPVDQAHAILERLGFARALAGVHGADPARPARKSELVALALSSRGHAAEDAVVVGDRRDDVEAAHANGAAAIGVAWGYGSRAELEDAGADWICASREQILERLDRWLARPLPVPRRQLIALRRAKRERPAALETAVPGQRSVWRFPRPPRLVRAAAALRVEHEGATLAHSTQGWEVQETASPPTYYLPPRDVDLSRLEPWDAPTVCEWKGWARYWRLRQGGPAIAWSYPDPLPGFEPLQHHLAFFASRVDACYVGQERALPQPGGYYGGWITTALSGPFKGVPGSERW